MGTEDKNAAQTEDLKVSAFNIYLSNVKLYSEETGGMEQMWREIWSPLPA